MSDRYPILRQPAPDQFLPWPGDLGRRFMVSVDTEEEFDWLAPFDRNATRVSAIKGLGEGQAYFAAAGVRPLYLVDYPVVESDAASALLGQWSADGKADIGAHLHPWVTPPHDETVNVHNSFAGNLPVALERAKLEILCGAMERRFGNRPIAYRAGRYGVGANTQAILIEQGFRLDCSIRSRYSYGALGGPDFTGQPLAPYWLDDACSLLELPLSTAYTGRLRHYGDGLHSMAQRSAKLGGGLSRLGLFSRIPLTPEGITAGQCIAAIDALLDDDAPVLSFSFHSPTLEPGHTLYTHTARDVADFYKWWDAVLNHLARRSVRPIGLDALLNAAAASRSQPQRSAAA